MILGLQTFTVRKEQKKNPYETIKKCTEMGYKAFELSRFELSDEWLEAFKKAKAECGAVYINFQKTLEDLSKNFDRIIKFSQELDCRTACISVLPLKYIMASKEATLEFCKKANELFDRFQEKGILLTYHTHDFEYIMHDGFKSIDIIKENIKTPLIIDAYWATRAGIYIPELINSLNGKVYALHLKDYNATFNIAIRSTEPVALGLGTLDIKKMIEVSKKNKLNYVAIEHHSKDPFTEMEISMKYLESNDLLKEFQ